MKQRAKCGLRLAAGLVPNPNDWYAKSYQPQLEKDWRARFAPSPEEQAFEQQLTAQRNSFDAGIASTEAMAGLSNTERYQLANPSNSATYSGTRGRGRRGLTHFDGAPAGSAAEASGLARQADIQRGLRDATEAAWRRETGYAAGGVVDPRRAGLLAAGRTGALARVRGPGTGTSDEVPMKIESPGRRGLRVNVSNGEALAVLPAATARNPRALDAVEGVIEATSGKPPLRGLRAGQGYRAGYVPFEPGMSERDWLTRQIAADEAWRTSPDNPNRADASAAVTRNNATLGQKLVVDLTPVGNVASAMDAYDNLKKGKIGLAALDTLGAVPVAGGLLKAGARAALKAPVHAAPDWLGNAVRRGGAWAAEKTKRWRRTDGAPAKGLAQNAPPSGTPWQPDLPGIPPKPSVSSAPVKGLAQAAATGPAARMTSSLIEQGDVDADRGRGLASRMPEGAPDGLSGAKNSVQEMSTLGFDPEIVSGARRHGAQEFITSRDATDYGAPTTPLGLRQAMPDGWGAISGQPGASGFRRVALVAPETYTGRDGQPTRDWRQTTRYAEATLRNQRMAAAASSMERERIRRTAGFKGASLEDKQAWADLRDNERLGLEHENRLRQAAVQAGGKASPGDLEKALREQRKETDDVLTGIVSQFATRGEGKEAYADPRLMNEGKSFLTDTYGRHGSLPASVINENRAEMEGLLRAQNRVRHHQERLGWWRNKGERGSRPVLGDAIKDLSWGSATNWLDAPVSTLFGLDSTINMNGLDVPIKDVLYHRDGSLDVPSLMAVYKAYRARGKVPEKIERLVREAQRRG